MPVAVLTPKRVSESRFKRDTYFLWDRKVRGLGLRVAKTKRKAYLINITRKGERYIEEIGTPESLTLKEARAKAKSRITALTALSHAGPDTPLEIMAELTMRRMERVWKPSTHYVNRTYLNSCILPHFTGRPVASITRSDVEDWYAGLQHKPGTAGRAVKMLSAVMREAEEIGARPEGSNPTHGLRFLKENRRERVLTKDEMARLGAAIEKRKKKHPLLTKFLTLLILTGCRKGELRELTWRDYRGGHLHLPDSKSGPKTIFLSSHARSVLDSVKSPRSGRVFPNPNNPTSGRRIDRFWYVLRKEVGLEDVRLHDLRHHYASVAIRQGESLRVIGTLLGHGDPDSVLRYAHHDDSAMRNAVEAIGEAMTTPNQGGGQ